MVGVGFDNKKVKTERVFSVCEWWQEYRAAESDYRQSVATEVEEAARVAREGERRRAKDTLDAQTRILTERVKSVMIGLRTLLICYSPGGVFNVRQDTDGCGG